MISAHPPVLKSAKTLQRDERHRHLFAPVLYSDVKTSKPTNYVEVLKLMRQNLAHKNNGIVPAFLQDEIIFQSSYVMLEMGFATGHIFDYVFKQLPKYPDWQEIIYHELLSTSSETQSIHSLALIAFIKETMRIAAKAKKFPMLIRPRRVLKDTTICGYSLPKGTGIAMNMYAIHHNPERWENPDEFNPARFYHIPGGAAPEGIINERDGWFTPFGTGLRKCPEFTGNSSLRTLHLLLNKVFEDFKLTFYS
eukprot:25413_1